MYNKQHSYSPAESPLSTTKQRIDQVARFGIFLIAASAIIMNADAAYAGNTACQVDISNVSPTLITTGLPGVESPFCNLFLTMSKIVSGLTGKALATAAIAIAGLMALFGKLSWVNALVISAGVAVVFGAASLVTPEGSVATAVTDSNPVTAVFDVIQHALQNETGRAIGIISAIILGIGAMYGKISWPAAMIWVAGIACVFGANALVNLIWQNPLVSVSYAALTAQEAGYIARNGSADAGVYAPFFSLVTALIAPQGAGVMVGSVSVIALGIGAMLGKVSWARALMVAGGIALFYGSLDVINILEGPLDPCNEILLPVTSDPFTHVICSFMEELQGPLGKMIAMMAIMCVGVMSMMGKISWEMALVVSVGIALIFGAYAILNLFEAGSYALGLNYIDVTTCSSPAPTPPSTGNAIADILCYIVNIIYGPAGKALAMISIIMMGFGALLGKISFSQAFVVAIGIAVTFGAPSIVGLLMPTASIAGCTLSNPAGVLGGASALAGLC